MTTRKRQLTWILIALVCVLCLDQASKAVVRRVIPEERVARADSAPTFFRFTHQKNTGLVGGIFHNRPFIAYTAPIAATFVLLYLFRYLDPASKIQTVAYGMVAGGACGNLIDRLFLGAVTDFLKFHFYFIPLPIPWKNYPAFNVADSAICIGVFLLIFSWRTPVKSDVSDAV